MIDWNEKLWAQNTPSKLSPNDAVRTATPSANSTESTPSSQRQSIGPEEVDGRVITPEIKSEFSECVGNETSDTEASNLLLSLSQPQLPPVTIVPTGQDQQQLAALRIEEKILHEKLQPQPEHQMPEKTVQSIESVVNSVATAQFDVDQFAPQPTLPSKQPTPVQVPVASTTPPRNTRAFFRAPGHGGPSELQQDSSKAFVCSICNFSCPSKFHYNSHMNTHGDHQCSMCDYTSRTEGRLKKHMREYHSREEQIAAGLEVPAEPPTPTQNTADFHSAISSIMEAANRAVNDGEGGSPISNALDSIRALTENGQGSLANFLQMPENSNDSVDAAGPSTPREPPRRSSGGKPKQYTCKQCACVSTSKEESWRHNRTHIPQDKILQCKQCEFVTEYKHHLEYHIRNHYGSKPFRCSKCNYSCVNKSMLNSHMKSHSNEYQFSCMDCSYQSKYCHSLKMHLRKYNHRRKPGINVDDAEEALANDPSLEEDASVHSAFSDSVHPDSHDQKNANPPPPVPSAPPTISDSSANNNNNNMGSVLLQPIATTSSFQYANLIRQNQEQINELARRQQQQQQQHQSFSCTVCDYNTPHLEQLLHHNMVHIQQNQTASAPSTPLNALLQYIQNNVQLGNTAHATIPNGTAAASIGGLSQLSAFQPTSTEMIFRAQQNQQQLQHDPEPPVQEHNDYANEVKMEIEHQSSPTPSINGDSSSLERSSTSPMDSKDNHINGDTSSIGSTGSSSSRKRKAATSGKLEQISQRLQGKNSPEQCEDLNPIAAPIPIPAYRQNYLVRF